MATAFINDGQTITLPQGTAFTAWMCWAMVEKFELTPGGWKVWNDIQASVTIGGSEAEARGQLVASALARFPDYSIKRLHVARAIREADPKPDAPK